MYFTKLNIIELEKFNYHTIINARVTGEKIRCVLDTGASHSCIDKDFALEIFPELQMETNEGLNAGIGGTDFQVFTTNLANFKIGRLLIPVWEKMAVIDLSNINTAYKMLKKKPVQMILGNDFLVEHNALVDYTSKKLFFTK